MKRMMEGTHMPEATLHDGSTIEIEVHGAGPTLLLPVNPQPVTGRRPSKCASMALIRLWANR